MSTVHGPILNPCSAPTSPPLPSNRAAQQLHKSEGQSVTAVVKGDIEQRGFRGDHACMGWGKGKGEKGTGTRREERLCRQEKWKNKSAQMQT